MLKSKPFIRRLILCSSCHEIRREKWFNRSCTFTRHPFELCSSMPSSNQPLAPAISQQIHSTRHLCSLLNNIRYSFDILRALNSCFEFVGIFKDRWVPFPRFRCSQQQLTEASCKRGSSNTTTMPYSKQCTPQIYNPRQ